MVVPSQISAARGLLGISQTHLAAQAGLGIATIKRVEMSEGEPRMTVQTLVKIQIALEAAGIMFIDQDETNGPGVRLPRPLP